MIWSEITRDQVNKYFTAVDIYFNEAIKYEPNEYEVGKILFQKA
jgi:hypothetical protein